MPVPEAPRSNQVRIVSGSAHVDPRMSKPTYVAIKYSGDAEDGMGWSMHLTVRGRTPQAALAEFEKGVEMLRAQCAGVIDTTTEQTHPEPAGDRS